MITTHALLDAVKSRNGITSEYRLARVAGITDTTLYNYRHGRAPDDERAAKLAEMAGLDVGYVLACMAAERAKDPGIKSAWAGLAKRLESVCAALLLAILANLFGVSFDAQAHASARPVGVAPTHMTPVDRLYIVASVLVSRFSRWVADLCTLGRHRCGYFMF